MAERGSHMAALLEWIRSSQEHFHSLGWAGPVAYALVVTLTQMLMAPIGPLAAAGGLLFGFQGGISAVFLGTALGAATNFLISRHTARSLLLRKIGGNPRFRLIDAAIGREGWRIIALLRFCPIPFGFANYAYGLTAVRFWPYLLSTVVAILPLNLLMVWIGSITGSNASADAPRVLGVPAQTLFGGLGCAAIFGVIVYVGRVARRVLAEQPAEKPGQTDLSRS
jgi:uncharacterized membrane protein YdjX (TVP38/TMEM64 family)